MGAEGHWRRANCKAGGLAEEYTGCEGTTAEAGKSGRSQSWKQARKSHRGLAVIQTAVHRECLASEVGTKGRYSPSGCCLLHVFPEAENVSNPSKLKESGELGCLMGDGRV